MQGTDIEDVEWENVPREEFENVVAVDVFIRHLIGKRKNFSDRSKEKELREAAAAFKEEILSLLHREISSHREKKKEDALFWKQMVSEDVLASHNMPAGVDDSDSSYSSEEAQE